MTQILPPEPQTQTLHAGLYKVAQRTGVNKFLSPFYYWVFGDVHVMLAGWVDYREMMKGLGRLDGVKGVGGLKVEMVEGGGDR